MRKIKILFTIAITSLILNSAFAASPLSSTAFYSVYMHQEIVQLAERQGFLDGKIAVYLIDDANEIDIKMAVINALNWGEKGQNSVDTYKMFMGRKYGKSYENLDYDKMSGNELLCLGYMVLLDEQRKLNEATPILEKAQLMNKNSFTTNMIYTMALAQGSLNDSNECQAWNACNDVRNNDALIQDMNIMASAILFESVDMYKDACN